jgi:hypothetical protein
MLGLHVDLEVFQVRLVQLDAALPLADLTRHFVERCDGVRDRKNVRNVRALREFGGKFLEVILPEQNADIQLRRLGNPKEVPRLSKLYYG